MKSCNKCLLPETHETITFNGDVCNICNNNHKKRKKRLESRKTQLDKIINFIRAKIMIMIVYPQR